MSVSGPAYDARFGPSRPPEYALPDGYDHPDFPGWLVQEDRWLGDWLYTRLADGYQFRITGPTSMDIAMEIEDAPPVGSVATESPAGERVASDLDGMRIVETNRSADCGLPIGPLGLPVLEGRTSTSWPPGDDP